jgi:4-hydroxybenzoate polyprenyltransferase/phosphoserine phosphatase
MAVDTKGPALAPATPRDIVVDLDGTLYRTDLLYEALLLLLTTQVWRIPGLLLRLLKGIAAFKRAVAQCIVPNISLMPVNEPVYAWLRERQAAGDRLWLYSASDQAWVDAVAARFAGLFIAARGSDGHSNLKGLTKYRAAAREVGERFVYAGDSGSDLPVWAQCGHAVICGRSASLRRRLAGGTQVVAEFPTLPKGRLRLWRRALRLHQWAKNALIFVPMILAGQLDPTTTVHVLLAFCALSVLASATYLINDLFDLEADREHSSKRYRPFASGDLSLRQGLAAAPLLMLIAVGLLLPLSPLTGGIVAIYACVTLGYSFGLKRQPVLDLIILSSLFTVRLWAGTAAAGVLLSPWLMTFSMFFFGSLATVKRYTECIAIAARGGNAIAGRGYRAGDAPWLLAIGASSGYSSVLVFFIYLVYAVGEYHQFRHPYWLWSVCPILAYWLGRIWLLTVRSEMRDDPISFALRDRLSIALGLLVVASITLAMGRL